MHRWIATLVVVVALNATSAVGGTLLGPFVPLSGSWTTVPNGGFENGMDGWEQLGPTLGTFASSNFAEQGTGSAASQPLTTFTGPGFGIARIVPVVPGETFVLSAFFNVGEMTSPRIHLDLSDVSFEVQPGDGDLLLGESAWQFVWQAFEVPADVHNVRVRVVRDFDVQLGDTAYVDEVAITIASEFQRPEPEVYLNPADCNFDGKVDGTDYLCWVDNFGDDPADIVPGRPENGDFNNDGRVDGLDYLLWADDYGSGPFDGVSVPEPAAWTLVGSAVLAVVLRRRRRL